jgi:methionine aminopeptidase
VARDQARVGVQESAHHLREVVLFQMDGFCESLRCEVCDHLQGHKCSPLAMHNERPGTSGSVTLF